MVAGDAVAREIAATHTDTHRKLQIITASLITTALVCLVAGGDNPASDNN
jgi:hypothetical protein